MKEGRSFVDDVNTFGQCLFDKDQGNQGREALFGETRDVPHQRTQIERHDDDQDQPRPHSDPQAEAEII